MLLVSFSNIGEATGYACYMYGIEQRRSVKESKKEERKRGRRRRRERAENKSAKRKEFFFKSDFLTSP